MPIRRLKSIFSFSIIFILLCSLAVCAYAQGSKAELQTKQDAAKAQYKAAQQELQSLQSAQQQTQQQLEALQQQAGSAQQQLSLCYSALDDARAGLAVAQQIEADAQLQSEEAQSKYDRLWEQTKTIFSAMQKMHDGGSIAILSQARNLYEVLTFSETLREISEKRNTNLAELSAQASALEEKEQQAAEAVVQAQNAEATLVDQQTQLDGLVQTLTAELQDADSTLDEQQAAANAQEMVTAEAKKAYEAASRELDAYVRSQSQKYTTPNLSCSLDFDCPLASYSYITTNFGEPDPNGQSHNGTDFAAPSGTPIRAVADGVISAAAWNGSYGNYVQVSHGKDAEGQTYDTLYAHMTSYCVSVGQTVTKGETIGYVGSTGFSTGNHLHLELRINGSRTNPLGYIPH